MQLLIQSRLRGSIDRAQKHLFNLQRAPGFWVGELASNVTMDAEDLLLRELLGIRTKAETDRSAAFIRRRQRADGTWANAHDGPADLSTTVEAYLALRLAGDAIDAPHMHRAATFIRANGGIPATRVFTRIWLAMFGLFPWDALPVLPPEIILLPPSVPLNVYDFACWARQTVVALSVVMTYRPVFALSVDLDELSVDASDASRANADGISRAFELIDAGLRRYARRPIKAIREHALREAERWIVRRQEADGSWGGIQPPWVYSLIALRLRGYPLDHPVMRVGLEGLDRFTIAEGNERRIEACQSPVWDTALALLALVETGVSRNDPRLVRAADWLLTQQVKVEGDWSVRRPKLEPGGWAFEFANVNYPDIDDSAEVMLALRAVSHRDPRAIETAVARGVKWVLGMQSKDGGFGAFDADNTRALIRHIPFCDFGEVIDEPSADVTAHAVEMLCREGLESHPATKAAVDWLLRHQEAAGSWFGRWGVNHVYGTGAVLVALIDAGVANDHPSVARAVRWLIAHQNEDGGWGEDVRSYDDASFWGRGPSTASQTAWAVLGLLAVDDERSQKSLSRGIQYLMERQRPDGGWDEPQFTGTGFPGDFYIHYALYRDVFPAMALGRYAMKRGVIELEPDARAEIPHVLADALVARSSRP